MLKSALMGESFNHGLLYDNQHILPYITDHLTMIPPTATVGYFGSNGTASADRRFETIRHTGRLLLTSLMASGKGQELHAAERMCARGSEAVIRASFCVLL
jgi:hypothetical protein